MARRWYNEDYRKLYTRQDGPWLALPWCARALAADLLRYADDKGVVAILEEGDDPGDVLGTVVRCKADEREMVARGTRALLKDGHLVVRDCRLIIKNFVQAQERLSQEAARQRRKRDKEAAMTGTDNGDVTPAVTVNVTPVVTPSVTPNVTETVTPMFAVSGRVGSGRKELHTPAREEAGPTTAQAAPPAAAAPAPPPAAPAPRWGFNELGPTWESAMRTQLGADGIHEGEALAGKIRELARVRSLPPPDLAVAILAAWKAMCADWGTRGVAPKGRGPKKLVEHFSAVVEWLDAGGAPQPTPPPAALARPRGHQPVEDDNRPRPKFVERYEPPDASHLVRVKRPPVQP